MYAMDVMLPFVLGCLDTFRVLCVGIIAVCLIVIRKRNQGKSLPGPWSIPIVGSLPFIGIRVHRSFMEFQRKYGDIFQIQIGCHPIVVLCGRDTIRKALVEHSPAFAGRPQMYTFNLASAGKSMVFNSYSPSWKAHRKLSEHALRLATNEESGFLKNVVVKEARSFAEQCLRACRGGSAVNPEESVLWSVAHVKYTLCYSNSHEDGDFRAMVDHTLRLIECHNRGNAVNFFPWAKFLLHKTFCKTKDICDGMLGLTRLKEVDHLATYREGRVRDALDALIKLGIKHECCLEDDRVMHTVQEYIGAGIDIVQNALLWMILYLAQYQDIQEKICEEIDSVLGRETIPAARDLHKMPLTHSFILEALRHSSVVPFTLPHATLHDTTLNGLVIPKNTFVLVNLYSVHHDAEIWPDPAKFNPDRFLSPDGQSVDFTDAVFFPFGIGRRRCVGEKLGMSELFVYLVSLLQVSRVKKPVSSGDYDLEPRFGVMLRPKPFTVTFQPR